MATDTIIGCGAFVFCVNTKRYLFLLRNKGKNAGTWGIVGGKIEPEESIIDALRREISEELGGSIQHAKILPIEKYTGSNQQFIYHTFLIKVEQEFIPDLNEEHIGYCWVPLESLPKPLHQGIIRICNSESVIQKLKVHQTIKD